MINILKLGQTAALAVIVSAGLSFTLLAAEHAGKEHAGEEVSEKKKTDKEHAGKEHAGKKHEDKEHAGKKHKEHAGKAMKVSAKDIKAKIKSYIKKDSKMKGGSFLIYDDKLAKTWRLKFVKIHNPVRIINNKTYFACMDFKEVGGSDVLDIDFWLEVNKKSKHHLKITKIKIHKLNGEPRFTYEKDKPVPVK